MVNVPAVNMILIHYDPTQEQYVCTPETIRLGLTHLICWHCNMQSSDKYQQGQFTVTVNLDSPENNISATGTIGGQTDIYEIPLDAKQRAYTYSVNVEGFPEIDPIIIIDEATPR
jgi:hypothetical protein